MVTTVEYGFFCPLHMVKSSGLQGERCLLPRESICREEISKCREMETFLHYTTYFKHIWPRRGPPSASAPVLVSLLLDSMAQYFCSENISHHVIVRILPACVLRKSDRSFGFMGDRSWASSSYPVEQEWDPGSPAWRRTSANMHIVTPAVYCAGCIQLRLRVSLWDQVAEGTNLRLLLRALAWSLIKSLAAEDINMLVPASRNVAPSGLDSGWAAVPPAMPTTTVTDNY